MAKPKPQPLHIEQTNLVGEYKIFAAGKSVGYFAPDQDEDVFGAAIQNLNLVLGKETKVGKVSLANVPADVFASEFVSAVFYEYKPNRPVDEKQYQIYIQTASGIWLIADVQQHTFCYLATMEYSSSAPHIAPTWKEVNPSHRPYLKDTILVLQALQPVVRGYYHMD
jgi:hypothetical protein